MVVLTAIVNDLAYTSRYSPTLSDPNKIDKPRFFNSYKPKMALHPTQEIEEILDRETALPN